MRDQPWHGERSAHLDRQPLSEATLCFLVRGNPPREILLGRKKAGFGAGKFGGFGGKVEAGETLAAAAARELVEESGLLVDQAALSYRARLTFLFPFRPAWSQVVHVYLSTEWEGEPEESVEMVPRWFAVNDIPYDDMWHDSRYWLPRILAGERFHARFTFRADNETVDKVEAGADQDRD